jgi:hypothetical protein
MTRNHTGQGLSDFISNNFALYTSCVEKVMVTFYKLLFYTLSCLVVLKPTYSYFVNFDYRFSWSMYNGAWIPETYQLQLQEGKRFLSRQDLISEYNLNSDSMKVPYGLSSLDYICSQIPNLKSVYREFDQKVTDYLC